ncbi:MAG: Uncharacterized protein XD94_0680, partial [Mesotoga prima]
MTKSLKILKDNRDNLLKVELAGWLHDMFKCSDEHIDKESMDHSIPRPNVGKDFYFSQFRDNDEFINLLSSLNESVSLTTLIQNGIPKNSTNENYPILVRYLGRCHGSAHIEKEA